MNQKKKGRDSSLDFSRLLPPSLSLTRPGSAGTAKLLSQRSRAVSSSDRLKETTTSMPAREALLLARPRERSIGHRASLENLSIKVQQFSNDASRKPLFTKKPKVEKSKENAPRRANVRGHRSDSRPKNASPKKPELIDSKQRRMNIARIDLIHGQQRGKRPGRVSSEGTTSNAAMTATTTTATAMGTAGARGSPKDQPRNTFALIESRILELENKMSSFKNNFLKPSANHSVEHRADMSDLSFLRKESTFCDQDPPPSFSVDDRRFISVTAPPTQPPTLSQFVTQVSRKVHCSPPVKEKKPSFLEFVWDPRRFAIKLSDDSEVALDDFKEPLGLLQDAKMFARNCQLLIPGDLETKGIWLGERRGRKKTLIFDLDETLIHCLHNTEETCDMIVEISLPEGETARTGINVRPHVRNVLRELRNDFEIVVFTASHECYANAILDAIDPRGELFDARLFRQHCIAYVNPEYTSSSADGSMLLKDLRILRDRKLEDIVIIDNSPYAFALQIENGITIPAYYEGTSDEEMIHLLTICRRLRDVPNTREEVRKLFRLHFFEESITVDDLLAHFFE
eukprot:TRINITY_DN11761_c0_g2_i1.p1 TRINITY_DN11761_c0_g2~~TRINITY_DN11761_c0_g2_i1.p1  ORF type:complete len:570 (+),score=131.38 TRINITY_DN11761_c0_g2_i1:129-1838(+)